MKTKRQVTDTERDTILRMAEEHPEMLHKDIAATVGVHVRTINRTLAKPKPGKAEAHAPAPPKKIPQGNASPVPAVLLAPLPLKPPGRPVYYR